MVSDQIGDSSGPAQLSPATAASDMYEIESGKLAQTKATAPEVKAFGAMLVTDHGKSSADLKAAAAEAHDAQRSAE